MKPRANSTYYRQFDCSDVFSGLAIETDTDNVDSLRAIPGVVNVWPMRSVPLAPLETKKLVEAGSRRTNYSMHQWTGVDRLHAAGIRGEGATIALIDTGVNYKHRAVRTSGDLSILVLTAVAWGLFWARM